MTWTRLPVLDGLRALAILLVMAMHVMADIDVAASEPLTVAGSEHIAWFLLNGWSGVQLFFVLSGFLIAGQLLDPRLMDPLQRRIFVRNYYIRRFVRIAPAYYLVLTIACYIKFSGGTDNGDLAWRYAYHLAFLQDYFPPDIRPLFWTLAVEAQFYLLAPFLVMALMRFAERRYLIMAGLMAALLVIKVAAMTGLPPGADSGAFSAAIRIPFHMALDGLLAGVLARLLWQDENLRGKLSGKPAAHILSGTGTALFFLLTAFVRPYYGDPPNMTFFIGVLYFPLVSGAFMLMMLGLLGGGFGYGLFAMKAWRGIAAISYSLYLIHTFFLASSLTAAAAFLDDAGAGTLWSAGFIILLLLCVPAAVLMYRMVEKPLIDEARRATGRAES